MTTLNSGRAAIYARVSTEDQAVKGYSLADQVASCKAYLFKLGYTDIVEYIDEGVTGEFIDRPALTSLREDIAGGRINIVAAYDPDRLARKLSIQLLIAEEMEKARVPVHFITGAYDASPEGRLFFSMRGAIAEFEKEKIRERTMRGIRRKASQGKIIKNFKLYGYNYDNDNCQYVINPEQANVIRAIFNMVIHEHKSVGSIQKELKARVILSPTGKPLWPTSSIYNLLTNRTYTGEFISMRYWYQKAGIKSRNKIQRSEHEWIKVKVPAIIDEVTFQRAQKQLSNNKAMTKKTESHPFLLGGIIFCGVCGRRMLVHHSIFRDGTYRPYYQCAAQRYSNLRNAGTTCSSRSLPAEALDNDVWNMVKEVFSNLEKVKKYLPKKEPGMNVDKELERLNKLESDLIKQRETIAKWFRQQMLSEKDAEDELMQIRLQLVDIQERKNALKPKTVVSHTSIEELAARFKPMLEQDNLTDNEKKALIRATLSKITVTRTDKSKGSKQYPKFKVIWELN